MRNGKWIFWGSPEIMSIVFNKEAFIGFHHNKYNFIMLFWNLKKDWGKNNLFSISCRNVRVLFMKESEHMMASNMKPEGMGRGKELL